MALGVVLATCIGAMTFHPVVPAVSGLLLGNSNEVAIMGICSK